MFDSERLLFFTSLIFSYYENDIIFIYIFLLSFQLPAFLSQVKEALGLPGVSAPTVPVAGPSAPVPVPVSSSVPPPIVVENSESDDDVQTLAVPFRSSSSEAFLPMVSTDDSWSTDAEFRFVLYVVNRVHDDLAG